MTDLFSIEPSRASHRVRDRRPGRVIVSYASSEIIVGIIVIAEKC